MPIELPARIAFLKKIHLFYGLDDNELAVIAEKLDESFVPKDGVVFKQGDRATSFYLIYNGSVRIARKQQGKEIQLARLVKDDYFGEMALVVNRLRSATVTATTDTLLLVLPRDHFRQLYKQAPHLRENLSLAIKSRELSRQLHFKWLRSDEVIYFMARKHPIVLYRNLIVPSLTLLLPMIVFYGWLTAVHFLIVLMPSRIYIIVSRVGRSTF